MLPSPEAQPAPRVHSSAVGSLQTKIGNSRDDLGAVRGARRHPDIFLFKSKMFFSLGLSGFGTQNRSGSPYETLQLSSDETHRKIGVKVEIAK